MGRETQGLSRGVVPLERAYELMRARFGHQHWWPGETPFEVCVGAILTQQTSWKGVERAMANLKKGGVLDAATLYALPEPELAALIRPAGFLNLKARRLRAFLRLLIEDCEGDLARVFAGGPEAARQRLLGTHGIGPETADCMLLYAGGIPRFVIDAYTRRVFARHGWAAERASYQDLQSLCEGELGRRPDRVDYWGDYHAQIVAVGKAHCHAREPDCDRCPLRPLLPGAGPKSRLLCGGRSLISPHE